MNQQFEKAPSSKRLEELLAFSKIINVSFSDINLLDNALTHTSYANETGKLNNERLEFLGDSVLGLVCAEYLYKNLPSQQEGDLSRIKAAVVSEESLAEVAHKLDLSSYIQIGHGEEINGGRNKKAILADAMEAVIAAIYLESRLQTYMQKSRGKVPEYILDRTEGPEHMPTFYVKVILGHKVFGPARGANKKQAEQNAAHIALEELGQL